MPDHYDEPMNMPRRDSMTRVARSALSYVIVVAVGVVAWAVVWGLEVESLGADASDAVVGLTFLLMIEDLLLGAAAVVLLPLRNRAPLAIAIVISAFLLLSVSAFAAAVWAVVRAASSTRLSGLVALGMVWLLANLGNGIVMELISEDPIAAEPGAVAIYAIIGVVTLLVFLVSCAIGRYRRARAESLDLLQERAERAEGQREQDIQSAKEAERMRIAREMHDVLAHRMSLVSMHAGALTYREDLPREKVAEAAHVIQDSAAIALKELRELLGVLRTADDDQPRSPQPSLEDLPRLLAESRAAGTPVVVTFGGIDATDQSPRADRLESSASRTVYRVVQEALTNARRHAPGEPVALSIARESDRLTIRASNELSPGQAAGEHPGMGLVGLDERIRLAGGGASHGRRGNEFVLTAWIPWA